MKLHKIISTGLGSGYSPTAPGTAGSAVGVLLFYAFNALLNSLNLPMQAILSAHILLIAILYAVALWAIHKTHKHWKHDDNRIVIDEIIGVGIALLATPLSWKIYATAFVLFRVFDIWKPLFIRQIDNIKSDNGVILDDVLAGVYAGLILQIIIYFKVF